jgi:hypothetical protein
MISSSAYCIIFKRGFNFNSIVIVNTVTMLDLELTGVPHYNKHIELRQDDIRWLCVYALIRCLSLANSSVIYILCLFRVRDYISRRLNELHLVRYVVFRDYSLQWFYLSLLLGQLVFRNLNT